MRLMIIEQKYSHFFGKNNVQFLKNISSFAFDLLNAETVYVV